MVESQPNSTTTPLFSVIIAVYDDWTGLDLCLSSLAQQTDGPSFEVVVVDDGSNEAAPEAIRQWVRCLPLTIVRQPHAGISAARNHGITISKGSVLLFVDADCRLQPDCLAVLDSTIAGSPAQLFSASPRWRLLGAGWPSRGTTAQNFSRTHAPARWSHSILEYCRVFHSTDQRER
jgi:glycosyltransferase involved in cell wall biosynthesis